METLTYFPFKMEKNNLEIVLLNFLRAKLTMQTGPVDVLLSISSKIFNTLDL